MKVTSVLRWMVRFCGLLALLLGLGLWNGAWLTLLNVHQALGSLMTGALIWLAVLALRYRRAPGLPVLALLWSVALLTVGTLQGRLLPGASHWIVEVLHLLLGVGAIALAELIGTRIHGHSPTQRGPEQLT